MNPNCEKIRSRSSPESPGVSASGDRIELHGNDHRRVFRDTNSARSSPSRCRPIASKMLAVTSSSVSPSSPREDPCTRRHTSFHRGKCESEWRWCTLQELATLSQAGSNLESKDLL